MTQSIESMKETIAAQAAVIKALNSALTYVIEDLELRASLKLDEDERYVVDVGDGAYIQAKKALAIPTDSTQILDEVRRAERERCAKVCDMKYEDRAKTGHIREASTARALAKEIRAIE